MVSFDCFRVGLFTMKSTTHWVFGAAPVIGVYSTVNSEPPTVCHPALLVLSLLSSFIGGPNELDTRFTTDSKLSFITGIVELQSISTKRSGFLISRSDVSNIKYALQSSLVDFPTPSRNTLSRVLYARLSCCSVFGRAC